MKLIYIYMFELNFFASKFFKYVKRDKRPMRAKKVGGNGMLLLVHKSVLLIYAGFFFFE